MFFLFLCGSRTAATREIRNDSVKQDTGFGVFPHNIYKYRSRKAGDAITKLPKAISKANKKQQLSYPVEKKP